VCWWTLDEIKRDVSEVRAMRVFDALTSDGVPVRVHDGSHLLRTAG